MKYPYLIFYKQKVDNSLSYDEYVGLYEKALPSENEYMEYHSLIGKLPLLTYDEMIKRERDGFKSKYESYRKITSQINSRPIDSDETYNEFIDECIENGYELFDDDKNTFSTVDITWKKNYVKDILVTLSNTVSRNGVIYSNDVLESMSKQINENKILCLSGIRDDFKIDLENVVGICQNAKVTEKGLTTDLKVFNGFTLDREHFTVGFCSSGNVDDKGNVNDIEIKYSYIFPKEDSQWKKS